MITLVFIKYYNFYETFFVKYGRQRLLCIGKLQSSPLIDNDIN